MTVAIRLRVPRNRPAPAGSPMFAVGPAIDPREGYLMLAADAPQRSDVHLFDLGDGSGSAHASVDFHLDAAPLPEVPVSVVKHGEFPGGFRAVVGERVYVGIPKDAAILMHRPAGQAAGYRFFEPWEDRFDQDVVDALRIAAADAGHRPKAHQRPGEVVEAVRALLSEGQASRAFADVASAALGYRRMFLDGTRMDGVRHRAWIAHPDGVTDDDPFHVSASGFGSFLDKASTTGIAKALQSLPPATPDEVRALAAELPIYRLALAWFERAPVASLREDWVEAAREAAFGSGAAETIGMRAP